VGEPQETALLGAKATASNGEASMRNRLIKSLGLLALLATGGCRTFQLIETGQAGKAWIISNGGVVYNCEANGPQAVCFPTNTN
jgi:hypothetical protein